MTGRMGKGVADPAPKEEINYRSCRRESEGGRRGWRMKDEGRTPKGAGEEMAYKKRERGWDGEGGRSRKGEGEER